MSRFSKSLLVGLLEQENDIKAFFGGGFKPPTKGHFLVVKKALENYPEIDTLYVVIGNGLRDNISQDESHSIWEMYKKYLPQGKVEIIKASNSPIKHVKDYIKANTKHKSYILIGAREDNDVDADDFIKRKDLFDRYGDHVEVKRITSPDGISGTKAREAAKTDKHQFYEFIPSQLTNEEKQTIYNYIQSALQEGTLKENRLKELSTDKIKSKLKFILGALKQESSETKEAFSKIIKSTRGEITLTDEEKKEIGEQMKDVLKLAGLATVSLIPGGTIAAILIKIFKAEKFITPSSFNKPKIEDILDEPIKEIIKEEENEESYDTFDYNTHIKQLTEFMLDMGLNIKPLPDVKFINDDVGNAEDFFGKTAYYDPQYNRIVLYTLNRHPKDVMRSFSHEMIHHMQNCEDRLGEITTQNTNEDDHLDEIEREAYEKGNICFRNWTDTLTEGAFTPSPLILNEGRYDKITNDLSSQTFNKWKKDFQSNSSTGNYTQFISTKDFKFEIIANIYFNREDDSLKVDGGVAKINEDGDIVLNINFSIDPNSLPQMWEDVSMNLKDVIRHEIEHITQDDEDRFPSKYMEDDQLTRTVIDAGLINKKEYFKLEKEIDANLQGLYLKAKKSKRPFIEVIDEYLDAQQLTDEEKEEVLDVWRYRANSLSLPKF